MEAVRSFWHHHSSGYTPFNNSPNGHSLYTPSQDYDSADGSQSRLDQRPLVSWGREANFDIPTSIGGLGRHIRPMLIALLPTFIVPSRHKKVRRLFPTSYLDGLRGVAAFLVVVHHYTTAYTEKSFWAYGHVAKKGEPSGTYEWFWLLPIVRVVHAGRFMVVIFFVISGYVLSHRSLKLAREGKQLELLDSLGSSVFRRWLRLHLPVAVSCFLAFVLARWNLWIRMPKGWEHNPTGKSYQREHMAPFPHANGTFFHQLGDLQKDLRHICDPFLYGKIALSKFNIGVLWTIPIEFMGSMLVFVVVLGIARTKTWIKLSTLCLLIYHCHASARWNPATFLQGVLLAELSFIYARPLEPTSPALEMDEEKEEVQTMSSSYKSVGYNLLFFLMFLIGIHFGSQPERGWHSDFGYQWMWKNLPYSYAHSPENIATFWPSIGAFLVIFSLDMAPYLQSMFTNSLAQYLGDISFALYLTHFQVQATLGEWLVPKMMNITGGWGNGQLGFVEGLALSILVLWPVTFWVADVFSRIVDERCVRFARWASTHAFVKI